VKLRATQIERQVELTACSCKILIQLADHIAEAVRLLNPAHEPSADSGTGRTEFWLWFDRFARELSPRQREVLILRYRRDLDDDQIGEILGISSSAVRSLVARACAALRRNPEIWQ